MQLYRHKMRLFSSSVAFSSLAGYRKMEVLLLPRTTVEGRSRAYGGHVGGEQSALRWQHLYWDLPDIEIY